MAHFACRFVAQLTWRLTQDPHRPRRPPWRDRLFARTRSALCRREGIAPNLYYTWSKEFLDAGKKRLVGDTERQADSRDVSELRNEISQLKQLVAELSLKNHVLERNVLGREKPWNA